MTKRPELLERREALARALEDARARHRKVALVPTMGALHRGHLSLVEEARRRVGDPGFVVVSIFVNPTQFGKNEDLARYPRDLEGDLARCAEAGVDAVFAPSVEEMYPRGEQTRVQVGALAEPLCGEHRPGHFEGVATIVAKLFALAGPSVAVFGKKDYQQLRVIQRMATDLMFPVQVVGSPTIREPDGLAMSSRNAYLSREDREKARVIPRALAAVAKAFENGERHSGTLAQLARSLVEPSATSIDYVSVADADSLAILSPEADVPNRALLALALRIGSTRLIDNLVLGEDRAPEA